MKKIDFIKRIKELIEEIYKLMKPFYLKQRIEENDNEIVEFYDENFDCNLLDLFTDSYDTPLELFVFKTTLYNTVLGCLVDGVRRKEWYYVYICISILSNILGDVKIGIDLGRLVFIKTSLSGSGDVYKRISSLILNNLLEDEAFVIVEDYKDFEILLELEKIKEMI
ncbi:hypothetical protein NGRA_1431 [Nosema granulosis]|uniref:Uncharacterized protein n=1 Tax=Nosema granulosis TaxID=83296 RepID=A0A9P6GYZ4_9MICR|nr:hypothetical protein NGRA_1431 [Nosema granulosis]